jgi:Disulphide bond corrector protein DsbC
MMRCCIAVAALGLVVSRLVAQERPVTWSLSPEQQAPRVVRPGELFSVRLTARLDKGWYLYSLTQPPGGPIATSITLVEGTPFQVAGRIAAPDPEVYADPSFNLLTEVYEGAVTFTVPLRVAAGVRAGTERLRMVVLLQACTDRYCLPPTADTLGHVFRVSHAAGDASGDTVSGSVSAGSEARAHGPEAPARAEPPTRRVPRTSPPSSTVRRLRR